MPSPNFWQPTSWPTYGYSTVNALETLALIVSETIRRRVWSGDVKAVVQARQELLPETR